MLDAILHKEPPAVARYNDKASDPLIRLVNKMLEKDREERYQTAHDVWVDLRRLRKEVTNQQHAGCSGPKDPACSAGCCRLDCDPSCRDKIAEAYQVNSLLVSSITAEPNRFVLNVQLLEARSKKMIWSNEFEATPGGYIELTRQAAEGIRNQLRPESKSAVSTSELPKNSEAELLFRQGKYFVNRYNNLHDPADFNLAYSTLTRALDLEPRLADAAAEIANLYSFQAETQGDAGEHTEDSIEQSKNWARRALEMNPQCARALSRLAVAATTKREGIELALRAIQLAPNDALAQNGLFFLSHDSLVLVVAMRKEANRLDPLYLYPYMNVAYMLKILGKPEEGLPYIERALQLEPDFAYGLYTKSILLLDLHRKQEASGLVKRVEQLVAKHRLPDYVLVILNTASTLEEHNEQALKEALARVQKMVGDPNASGHDLEEIALDLVPWFAKYGRNEEALHILDEATKRGGVPMYDWLMLCPQLSSLRDDPRFQNATATARPQFIELITLLQEARSRKMLPAYLEAPLAQLTAQLDITKQAQLNALNEWH